MRRLSHFVVLLIFWSFPTPGMATPLTVLFDQGHGQIFTIEKTGDLQLDKLADLLRRNGWQVAATTEPLTPQLLAKADALIISGAFRPLAVSEIEAIGEFIHKGGRLVVMLHIAPPLAPLLENLGITFLPGVIREGQRSEIFSEEPLNFKVSNFKEHPLTKGLAYFSVHGAWPLLPGREGVSVVATTSPAAWVDLNRDQVLSPGDVRQKFAVQITGSAGEGKFVVFADDAIFQNRFLEGENEKLAENLSRWLIPGKSAADAE